MAVRCPQCEQPLEREESVYCAECGAAVAISTAAGTGQTSWGLSASAGADGGHAVGRWRGQTALEGDGAGESPGGEPHPGGTTGDIVPLQVEINDNHFYMEGCQSGLDFRLTNRAGIPVRLLNLIVEGQGLDVGRCALEDECFEAGEVQRTILPVTPRCFGEPVLHIELHCELAGEVFVFTAQGFIRVLRADERVPDLVVNIDQSIRAAENARIGYGLSVRDQVQADQLRGLIRTPNDLLTKQYSDQWQRLPLRLNGRKTRRLKEAYRPPLSAGPAPQEGAWHTETAALEAAHNDEHAPRVLLLALPKVRFGRSRGNSDVVLRVHPRNENNDRLSRCISARTPHFTIQLEPRGIYLSDGGSTNGTMLDGRPVAGAVVLVPDSSHRVDVGGALGLEVKVLGMDERDRGLLRRIEAIDPHGPVQEMAVAAGVRAIGIRRVGNLEQLERYLLIYQWVTLGGDGRADVELPGLAPGPPRARLYRGEGFFWLEPLEGDGTVVVDGATLDTEVAVPLGRGSRVTIGGVALTFGPPRQWGL